MLSPQTKQLSEEEIRTLHNIYDTHIKIDRNTFIPGYYINSYDIYKYYLPLLDSNEIYDIDYFTEIFIEIFKNSSELDLAKKFLKKYNIKINNKLMCLAAERFCYENMINYVIENNACEDDVPEYEIYFKVNLNKYTRYKNYKQYLLDGGGGVEDNKGCMCDDYSSYLNDSYVCETFYHILDGKNDEVIACFVKKYNIQLKNIANYVSIELDKMILRDDNRSWWCICLKYCFDLVIKTDQIVWNEVD